MTIEEVAALVQGEIICGDSFKDREVAYVFASDLMSDVLTILISINYQIIKNIIIN